MDKEDSLNLTKKVAFAKSISRNVNELHKKCFSFTQ